MFPSIRIRGLRHDNMKVSRQICRINEQEKEELVKVFLPYNFPASPEDCANDLAINVDPNTTTHRLIKAALYFHN